MESLVGEEDSHASDPLLVGSLDSSPRSSSSTTPTPSSSEDHPSETALEASSMAPSVKAAASPSALAVVDKWLQRYVTYMSSALHHDRGLKFLQWTLWLISRLVQKSSHSKNLRKLYLDLSFARYASRFMLLPSALEATRSGSWTPSSVHHPTLMKWIGRALAWSMAVYYPTEHVAYVQWMLPSAFPPQKRTAERWSYISCRAWLVYLVAEATQCLIQWRELSQEAAAAEDKIDEEDDHKGNKMERQLALRKVKVLLTRDLLFLLPCINWSLPNWDFDPWLPESVINTLMWLESLVCLTQ